MSFSIKSYTYSIKKGEYSDKGLLDGNQHYVIPVYQREFCWDEDEDHAEKLLRLVKDIYASFLEDSQTPYFISSMLFSKENEIIDGQQRLTTLSILLKELKFRYRENSELKQLDFDNFWLETQVDNKLEQKYMEDYFKSKKVDEIKDERNSYASIGQYIGEYLDAKNKETPLDSNGFIDYVLKKVLFVVIEAEASFSKKMKMFDAINTGGESIDSDNLFKLHVCTYLIDKEGAKEKETFKEMNKKYERIEKLSSTTGLNVNVSHILSTYQMILVKELNLPNNLFEMHNDKFFQKLFDVLLGITKDHEGFTRIKKDKFKRPFEKLDKIINLYPYWQKEMGNWDYEYLPISKDYTPSADDIFAYKMIWINSSYAKYIGGDEKIPIDIIPYLLYYKKSVKEVYKILRELNKLFFIYSVYASPNKVKSFMYKLLRKINSNTSCAEIIKEISQKIKQIDKDDNDKYCLKENLEKPIYNKDKQKRLVCIMSEYLRMPEKDKTPENFEKWFFTKDFFHIEHINPRAKSWKDKDLQNGIGNLTLLEGGINIVISANKFSVKQKGYNGSHYPTASKLAKVSKYRWEKADAEKRRKIVIKEIFGYLGLTVPKD